MSSTFNEFVNCPNCGNPDEFHGGAWKKKCKYCNTTFTRDKHIVVDGAIKKLKNGVWE